MKLNSLLTILPALGFISCTSVDPAYDQGSTAEANPYGVPGVSNTNPYDTGNSTYTPDASPYQPVQPVNPPAYNPPAYNPPAVAPPTPGGGVAHTVVSGDSLWGLSRKYNTTVEAIQAANGLTDTVIRTGQTLQIPR